MENACAAARANAHAQAHDQEEGACRAPVAEAARLAHADDEREKSARVAAAAEVRRLSEGLLQNKAEYLAGAAERYKLAHSALNHHKRPLSGDHHDMAKRPKIEASTAAALLSSVALISPADETSVFESLKLAVPDNMLTDLGKVNMHKLLGDVGMDTVDAYVHARSNVSGMSEDL